MLARSIILAAVSAVAASAYTIPACWETCFEKYNIQSEGCLCSAPIEEVVSSCISVGCPANNATSSATTYEAWVSAYCGTPVVTTTSISTAYTTVCPVTETETGYTNSWTTSTVSTVIISTSTVTGTWTAPVTTTYTTSTSASTGGWSYTSWATTLTPGVNTWTGTASIPWTAAPTTPATTPATTAWTSTATSPATTTAPPPYVAGAAGLKVGGVLGAVGAVAALIL